MEQIAYERPREKLRARGSAHLTTTELVQIIIGSGSVRMSGARLAKHISQSIAKQDVSFEQLLSIQGIGLAKASQVIAALELGKRYAFNMQAIRVVIDHARIKRRISKCKDLTLIVYFFDGAASEIEERLYLLNNKRASMYAQLVAKDALSIGARFLVVVLGSKRDSLQTTTVELDILKHLRDASRILAISIERTYRSNSTTVEAWSDT